LEHALTCPLPVKKNYQLIQTLRDDVLAYLEWVTHDLVRRKPTVAVGEIQRAADRLKEIALG
jgi:hypothetical protein